MQKIIIILILIISISGCSILKSRKSIIIKVDNKKATVKEKIIEQNISSLNFTFPKIEILVEGSGGKQRLIANIKYVYPGEILVSIRNNTGIEGARIYIDKDTVLANDRINRKMYYGSSGHLYDKYGLSAEYLPVLIGDMIIGKSIQTNDSECKNGQVEIYDKTGEKTIKYIADCAKNKVIGVKIISEYDKYQINAEFSNFKKLLNTAYPSNIRINDPFNGNLIQIEIKRAEKYKGPELKFIPGNNYELIMLQ